MAYCQYGRWVFRLHKPWPTVVQQPGSKQASLEHCTLDESTLPEAPKAIFEELEINPIALRSIHPLIMAKRKENIIMIDNYDR